MKNFGMGGPPREVEVPTKCLEGIPPTPLLVRCGVLHRELGPPLETNIISSPTHPPPSPHHLHHPAHSTTLLRPHLPTPFSVGVIFYPVPTLPPPLAV